MKPKKITEKIYQVGGASISDARDCSIYLLDLGELVLVDSGLGRGFDRLVRNIELLGFNPSNISTAILTHCHVDHIGGAHLFREHFGTRLIMHTLDARIVERADTRLTAAFCFDIDFKPLIIDTKLKEEEESLHFGNNEVVCLHTPGHSPGSLSLFLDAGGKRVLFAQDICAPLLEDFDCDPPAWMNSVRKLFALDADMLCDGHSGAYGPKNIVRQYLQYCIDSQRQTGRLIL